MKIFIDENLSPFLAKGLHILKQPMADGFEVLSIKEVFGKGIKDEDWIPQVGKLHGLS
jgi:PIN like domain